MTRTELVAEIARRAGVPRKTVAAVLDLFSYVTLHTMAAGEKVLFPGFGVFYPYEVKATKLFGGRRASVPRRKIRFRQSRRIHLEKLGVVISDEAKVEDNVKVSRACPKCGGRVFTQDGYPKCEKCGTEPFEPQPKK
jgi:nucleoid DNA-binding protein